MRKLFESRVAAVAVGATVIVGLGATGATAADLIGSEDIDNQSIKAVDIDRGSIGPSELRRGSVRSSDIDNGSIQSGDINTEAIRLRDLRPFVKNELFDGDQGVQGLRQTVETLSAEVEEAHTLVAHATSTPADGQWGTTVDHIGGSIGTQKTDLVSVNLEPGTYEVRVDGAFMYPTGTQPHDASIQLWPQLSLWVDENGNDALDWDAETGGEGSISPNELMPAMNDRHITVSGSTILTITEAQAGQDGVVPVNVSAFGYDSNRGTAGAGHLQALAELSVVEVEVPESQVPEAETE